MYNNMVLNLVPGLSTRLFNILVNRLGCSTVGDVLRLDKKDIIYTYGIGPATIRELKEVFNIDFS